MREYVCANCGQIHRSTEPPEKCCLCGSPHLHFWRERPDLPLPAKPAPPDSEAWA